MPITGLTGAGGGILGLAQAKGRGGPNLAHVASRRDLGAGMMRNANENGSLNDALLQENLRTWIEDPEQI